MKKDLFFNVSGDNIKTDHSFHLFSSLCELFPGLHDNMEIGISRIDGEILPNRMTRITDRSRLRLRAPIESIPELLVAIQNKEIRLGDSSVKIGNFDKIIDIKYYRQLYSRIVTIRNKTEPQEFYLEAEKILNKLGLEGVKFGLKVPDGKSPIFHPGEEHTQRKLRTRTFNMKGHEVVGYGVIAAELNKQQSIALQEKGLGGRRHFGCGIFIPWKFNGKNRFEEPKT